MLQERMKELKPLPETNVTGWNLWRVRFNGGKLQKKNKSDLIKDWKNWCWLSLCAGPGFSIQVPNKKLLSINTSKQFQTLTIKHCFYSVTLNIHPNRIPIHVVIFKAFSCTVGLSIWSHFHHGQWVGDVILEQPGGKNVLHIIQLSNLWRPPALPECLQQGTEPPPAPGIALYGWPYTQTSLQK